MTKAVTVATAGEPMSCNDLCTAFSIKAPDAGRPCESAPGPQLMGTNGGIPWKGRDR